MSISESERVFSHEVFAEAINAVEEAIDALLVGVEEVAPLDVFEQCHRLSVVCREYAKYHDGLYANSDEN